MDREKLEAKLWALCDIQRYIIRKCAGPVREVIKLGIRRQDLMDEILDGFEAMSFDRAESMRQYNAQQERACRAEEDRDLWRASYNNMVAERDEALKLLSERVRLSFYEFLADQAEAARVEAGQYRVVLREIQAFAGMIVDTQTSMDAAHRELVHKIVDRCRSGLG